MATSSWVHNLGFQSVTRTAFVGLLASYGLPSSTPDFNGNGSVDTNEQISGSGLQAKHFIIDFGDTYYAPLNNYNLARNYGCLAPTGGPDARFAMVGLLVNNGSNFGGVESGARPVSATAGNALIGTWLVRDNQVTVAEPGSIAILSMGLFAIGIARRA